MATGELATENEDVKMRSVAVTEEFYSGLGRRVREAREAAGWTQSDVACQIGLSRTSITNVELGQQRLLVHQVVELARALDVSVAYLIGEDARATGNDMLEQMRHERDLLSAKLHGIAALMQQ